jgi:hypothetical protein
VFLTDVGAYNYPGPYGHMDMGGNVDQFTDSRLPRDPQFIDTRGGSWRQPAVNFQGGGGLTPGNSVDFIGFRVAMVPEPGTLTLIAIAAFSILAVRMRRKIRRLDS